MYKYHTDLLNYLFTYLICIFIYILNFFNNMTSLYSLTIAAFISYSLIDYAGWL